MTINLPVTREAAKKMMVRYMLDLDVFGNRDLIYCPRFVPNWRFTVET